MVEPTMPPASPITPASPIVPTIPFVKDINAAVMKDPKCIMRKAVNEIEAYFTKHQDLYEITWPTDDSDMCRAFVDVDGMMASDTTEVDFDAMNDAVHYLLTNADFGTPFSLMTASRFKNVDWKKKTTKNKLSYRITFTHKCGTKEAVTWWTREVIAPQIKTVLDGTIRFFIKGVDTCPSEEADEDYMDWDNSVYRSHGKMRVWNSSKPNEERYNVLVKGDVVDTLLNYIPEGCEVIELPKPKKAVVKVEAKASTAKAPVTTPEEPVVAGGLTAEKQQIVTIMNLLPVKVRDDYNEWLSVGMTCFNEELPLAVWDDWSKASSKYSAGACDKKWASFKKGNFTQSYIWSLLKRDEPALFKEHNSKRSDFQKLVMNPTHFGVAEYFYNTCPYDYLYDAVSGWFGVTPSNIWEHTAKIAPPTLRNKIVSVLKMERIHLEVSIGKQKMAVQTSTMSDEEKKIEMERLDNVTKKCLDFRGKIENDAFQKGILGFLAGLYAEQSMMLLISKNAKPSDGVITVFDTNPQIYAFTDCLYDFTIKEFRAIKPTDYITITCGYPMPKPNAAVRREIMAMLEGIWEDAEPRDFILTLLASCLNGVRNMEAFTILTGRGGNGKGVLWELVMKTFGGYYYDLPKDCLTKSVDSATAATPLIANLRGMRCVGSSEPEANELLQEGKVKLMTGGDLLTARINFGNPFTFKPQFGLFIQCNTIPEWNKQTKGAVRRVNVLPFPFSFVAEPKLSYERPGDPRVKNVLCKSDEWRNEFFHILLDYYPMADGKSLDAIPKPRIVAERTAEYMEENNSVGSWWRENYEIAEGEFLSSRQVLDHYKTDTNKRITDKEMKSALAFNDIDIVKISRGPLKGKMGIVNYRRVSEPDDTVLIT